MFILSVVAIGCLFIAAPADSQDTYVGGWDPRICCYPVPDECCPGGCPGCADVSIIVDMSSSVGLQNWEEYQSVFIKEFATTDEWTVSDGSTDEGFQLSLVTFSTAAQLIANWGEVPDAETFTDLVDDIEYMGGLTDMGEAMELARTEVIMGSDNRPNCADFCVFITDGAFNPGQHTDNFNEQFPLYRDACETLIVVAIRLSSVDMTKLEAFIAEADASLFVDEFEELPPIFDDVLGEICTPTSSSDGCCPYDFPQYLTMTSRRGY